MVRVNAPDGAAYGLRGGGVHLRLRPARPQVQPGPVGGVLVPAVGFAGCWDALQRLPLQSL